MSKIRFNVPKFFNGDLPANGSTVSKDVVLIGEDGTTVTVKADTNMIYTSTPASFFEGTVKPDNRFNYQFVFPLETVVNSNYTQFTTPKKSVYIFSDNAGFNTAPDTGKITKWVMKGTIDIKPPSSVDIALAQGKGKAQEAGEQIDTLVDNSVLLEASIAGSLSDMFGDKKSPFYSIGLIIYKLVMDLLVVIIFWVLFVSISFWLKIPSKYIYPVDVKKYPFVFYREEGVTQDYYDIMQPTNDALCKPFNPAELASARQKQAEFFNEIDALTEEKQILLKIIYPAMTRGERKPSNIPKFSSMITEKCEKTEICTMDNLNYFVGILGLTSYLYCATVMAGIHSAGSIFMNKVVGNLDDRFTIVVFAALLYYLFLTVGEINKTVIKMFKIDIKEGDDIQSMMVEQFQRLLVSILSSILGLAIPICTMLIITCLLSTIYVLCKTCLFPFNFALLFMAFITLFFSMTQYIVIIKSLAAYMDPLGLLERIYVKNINIQTIASFLGITMPILFGFAYGGYVAFNLFFTFFQFIRRPEMAKTLKTTSASVVLVGLMLLLFHVKEILGNTYFFMTIVIIILVGLYMLTKTN